MKKVKIESLPKSIFKIHVEKDKITQETKTTIKNVLERRKDYCKTDEIQRKR